MLVVLVLARRPGHLLEALQPLFHNTVAPVWSRDIAEQLKGNPAEVSVFLQSSRGELLAAGISA